MTFLFLFFTFSTIGLFAIGGGFATIPFFFQLADNHPGWLTRETIGNMLAVVQASPGAIGANLSAYAGLLYAGIPGGYMAALGLIAPAIVIITIVARTLKAFKESVVVKSLFSGFRPAAAGLLSSAAFGVIALSLWNASAPAWYAHIRWKELLLFALLFFLIVKFKKHPVIYVIAAGAAGVIFQL